jgi:hypothetical protein
MMLRNIVAVAVMCLAPFAPAARAEDKPQKKPSVVPITKVFDLDEVTRTVQKLFPAKTVIVPLPDEHALLVYMTDSELAELRDILKKCVPEEPAKPAEKTYSFHMKDAKWDDVLDWYAKESGRKADIRVKPKGTFTCLPGKDRQFTLGEITDLINEALAKQKLLLIPNQKTFVVISSAGKIDPKFIPAVEFKDLPKLPRTAIVEAMIPVTFDLDEEITDELMKFLTPFGEVLFAKRRWLIVRETVGNISRIHEALQCPCAEVPGPLKFSFHMKDAKWDEVFAAYEKLSGQQAHINSKPTGTFTFVPAKREQRFTLAEITDIINDALLAKQHLLIRWHMTFVVVPADEKVDPTLIPRIELSELPKRGRTELVQVIIPVAGVEVIDAFDAAKKMTGSFGSIVPLRNGILIVTDTTANVAKIKKTLDELTKENLQNP